MRMRKQSYICALFCAVCFAARASLLRPATFPKTADDLSFVDRLMLYQEGYEPFESIYDKDGNCIAGCAYVAPRLEDELAAMARWNALAKQDLVEQHGYVEQLDGTITPPPAPVRDYDIPYGNPLGHMACITSQYGQRMLHDKQEMHYGIDFRAAEKTPVYAPANGTVLDIFDASNGKPCGNGIKLQHGGGYTTTYCHLSKILVAKDQSVQFGTMIAKTGNTGRSDAAHLHYGIQLNNDPINPYPDYLEPSHVRCPGT